MALAPEHQANFATLVRAAQAGDLALLDCQERAGEKPLPVLCAANRNLDGSIEFVPLAILFCDNPYEWIDPPRCSGESNSA